MRRYEVTDFAYPVIALLPPNKPRGAPRADDRRVLNGIFCGFAPGSPWADIKPSSRRVSVPVFSPWLYRRRNLVGRFFGKVKHSRGIATRFEKHDANYLALVKLATARIWMRFMSR